MDELLKQNASLETLSKGQEQALTKKEKQLQVSSQGLSSVAFVKSMHCDGTMHREGLLTSVVAPEPEP